jgi:hypothetical protein
MRQPAEFFDDREVSLIHIAGTLRGALRLEQLLTEQGIDYAVETDRYVSGFFFATEKTGAFFYVLEGQAEYCRALLAQHGFSVTRES